MVNEHEQMCTGQTIRRTTKERYVIFPIMFENLLLLFKIYQLLMIKVPTVLITLKTG